jgi:hypothetical protein
MNVWQNTLLISSAPSHNDDFIDRTVVIHVYNFVIRRWPGRSSRAPGKWRRRLLVYVYVYVYPLMHMHIYIDIDMYMYIYIYIERQTCIAHEPIIVYSSVKV